MVNFQERYLKKDFSNFSEPYPKLDFSNFSELAIKKYCCIINPMNDQDLLNIGQYILQGLTEKESCILSDVNYDLFTQKKDEDEITRNFLEKKKVEFKQLHLKTIQSVKSDKNSMYLLEKLRPEEFGSKPKGEGPTINIISAIMKEIQNDNSNPIIALNRENKKIEESDQGPAKLNAITALN
tara:strand:- start:6542 stop:7087 length:546 start_codon:yes stop_codon:yes gene_type:complete